MQQDSGLRPFLLWECKHLAWMRSSAPRTEISEEYGIKRKIWVDVICGIGSVFLCSSLLLINVCAVLYRPLVQVQYVLSGPITQFSLSNSAHCLQRCNHLHFVEFVWNMCVLNLYQWRNQTLFSFPQSDLFPESAQVFIGQHLKTFQQEGISIKSIMNSTLNY